MKKPLAVFALLFSIGAHAQTPNPATGSKDRTASAPFKSGILTPKPPYPYQAVKNHIGGAGSVKVTFDASGMPTSAVMVKSTGSSLLDYTTT